jgi:TolB protein
MKKALFSFIMVIFTISVPAQNQKIISRLEIFDVSTSKRTVVKQFDFRIEAPNWTPDGKFLVYNCSGLIYKIPVTGGESEIINTGSITTCNNDHIISNNGKYLAISASGKAGKSQVFILPITGGEPRLVTPNGPSYLHGFSPDNKFLSYCAERDGNFDVYIIPAEGGEEIRLTNAIGLDDGPEYSSDGKTIWFNSVRSGLMQAWRMNPDGTDQKQMTFDEANSWFPHLSPDRKMVVLIVYKKDDVEPGSHPANKNVEIRIMNAEGGRPKTIVKLFGGQGTLNVNSWAPDSEKFAFVSYQPVN